MKSKSEMKRIAAQNPDVLIEKIPQLEAKLAIAVEALEIIERCELARVEKMPGGLSEIPLQIAREALEKIK